jgi:hypothetical protein
VTATWKLRGWPWLAASIRLSQAVFRLRICQRHLREKNSCWNAKIWAWAWS